MLPLKECFEVGMGYRKEANKEERQKKKKGLNSSDCLHHFKRKYVFVSQRINTKRDHNNKVVSIFLVDNRQ